MQGILLGLDGFFQVISALPDNATMLKVPRVPRRTNFAAAPTDAAELVGPRDRLFVRIHVARDYLIFEEQL